ncbi:MAG: DUF4159 domain-containing protein [Phycisphaerales bacterium]|jgi:hypothetical protein|nr:DUF4159 domain-containing protein [Phycisphaerales bacterium]
MNELDPSKPVADRIDEIPTDPSAFKALVASIAAAMLAGLGYGIWKFGPPALAALLDRNVEVAILLEDNGLSAALVMCCSVFGIIGAVCGVCGVLSLLRIKITYHMLRGALVLVYPAVLGYVVIVWRALFSVVGAELSIDGAEQDRVTAILFWWSLCWPALAIGAYAVWLHAMLRSRSVYAAFTRKLGPPMRGDRVLEDWRTHGRDPRARRSFYMSFLTHVMIIIIIPFLMQARGCIEAYRVPKGSGNPVVAMVKMVKPKKKKKKTLTLRPNSAILFEIPDLDDTEVDRMMEEQTQATYQASVNAKAGKMGKGGGTKGGWPAGMENYKIRFIRLEHGGAGWDDGMNQTGADINFLRAFARATGFKKIASKGESHPISLLARYPADGFPPFVYLTGNGSMGRISAGDMKILREYCLNGGMLIADAGSDRFDRSFRDFMRKVFKDKQLRDIADDDMLYQLPFGFPNGAPAFWHHGGRRALGLKHEGRWIVFYHPGDMNDAWKSPGYSKVTPEMRDAAIHLGVNLVYYAFNQWNDAVSKLRK